ncbi:tail fiber domain-containing protein [Escherichia coli]|uniref:tail fiber domain-containing protein n=1 Tax=Escherichia coli TaxID=562 RepID=UPI001F1007EB|nr:tail fiber domain-containing protein [Escherichia coli]MCH4705930.1 tail fiber domain-containing protein [Escherichia coli]
MIYTTGTIAINGNTVTGTGTNFSAPLSLIRVGCTLIAISNPIQIFTITEIKSGTELSVTPAANPAIAAGTKFSILLSDSISVDGLAQDVAETLRFYQEKEDEISSAIDGSNIGLGPEPRDCVDISGDPSSYVGFLRIKETTKGFPSVAAGESFLSGFICQRDTTPSYTGVFVGWATRSLYTYTWVATSGPNWIRHARKNEVDRLVQRTGETRVCSQNANKFLTVYDSGSWGCFDSGASKYIPLSISAGGTGATNVDDAKKNLGIPYTGIGHWFDCNAPTGAEATKYYPVIITQPSYYDGDFFTEVAMRTKPIAGNESPNCNAIHLWMRDAGWSDVGQGVFGHYHCHASDEVAILCVRGTDKDYRKHNAVYVRGDAFPIRIAVTVGCTVTIPTADWKPTDTSGAPTYKWGITSSSDGLNLETYGINSNLLDFTNGLSGFYCTDAYRNKYGNPAQVVRDDGTILPTNGVATYLSQDWNAQQSDGVNKFKPVAGSTNAPDGTGVFGGLHVGFSDSYATQFAGRNSNFYARSFEAGVDKGWCQLATLNTANTWTNTNKFYGHYIVDSSYTRFIRHIPYASTTANIHVTTWGSSGSPLNYEVKAVDVDSTETSLKTLFTAKYLSDGSAALMVGGVVNCTSVVQSSDRDLKDNIHVIGDATEAIRKMNGYTYTLKENGLPYAGVIAQEVMDALPEAVGSFTHYGKALQGPTIDGNELREETRYLNVDYAAVTGLLVQVARETDNRVTELEEENASLRDNIAAMDERIAKLEALVSKLTGSEK